MFPTISPTQQNWLKTATGKPTVYAPGLKPGASNGGVLGAMDTNFAPMVDPDAAAKAKAKADDIAFLNDQASQFQGLLGRTNTALNQGLTQNEDQYNSELGAANGERDKTYAGYADQRINQNQGKLSAYDQINRGANNGYRSLSQIIGRSAGTGSSAFRDLLPDVIGKDTSSKRQAATDTYGRNLQGIDKAQGQYDLDFQGVLQDLQRQKKLNESALRSGVEDQRQNINGQLASVTGQLAQARGGGFNDVRVAQAPYQNAIENSRNTVESFFDRFRTPYSAKQAVAATPDLAGYTTDRTTINGGQPAPGSDSIDPYAALLRRKLQGQA